MKSNSNNQIESVCTQLLKESGIKKGQNVLDFGCGDGVYTIPAAKIVGNKGKVYAIDENSSKLESILKKCEEEKISNIVTINTNGELHFDFKDAMFDAVLLYDIFWYFPAGDRNLIVLLKEIYRICKNGGLLSVYPEHTDTEKLKNIIMQQGFRLIHTYSGKVVHENVIVHGKVFNFLKDLKFNV